MDFLEAVSLSATVVTLFLMGSGIPLCYNIIRTKTAHQVPYMQFLLMGVNGLAWLYYGLLITDSMIINLNLVGAVLQIIYMVVFLMYTSEKVTPARRTLISVVLCVTGYIYFHYLCPDDGRVERVGLVAAAATTALALAPLELLVQAWKTRDTSCMSLTFSVLGGLCAGLWGLYGFLISDWVVMGPQVPGVLVNLVSAATVITSSDRGRKVD